MKYFLLFTKKTLLVVLLFTLTKSNAQSLSFSLNPASQCNNGGNNVNCALTATSAGATSYQWNVVSPSCTVSPLNSGLSPTVSLSLPCVGAYTITCSAYTGSTLINQVALTTTVWLTPTLTVSSFPNLATGCLGTTFTLSASGANSYTWSNMISNSASIVVTPSVSTCYSVTGTNSLGCQGTAVLCTTLNALPNVSVTNGLNLCSGATAVLTASGATNYTWLPGATTGPSLVINPTASICYTVVGAGSSTCLSQAVTCVSVMPTPTITISGPVSVCLGANATLTASGAVNYSWSIGSTSNPISVTAIGPACYTVNGMAANGCTATANSCFTVVAPNASITISPTSACVGSSVCFTASGAISYTWNHPGFPTTSTACAIVTSANFAASLTALHNSGCIYNYTVPIPGNACAIVWPGDANRDGIANNIDVFEIGIAAGATGAARTPTSISWSGQYALNWSGTNSTGWNRCHVDCNGDGIINSSDNAAIAANYSLTHVFKSSESATSNPDIKLLANSPTANGGLWNKVDIMLGDITDTIYQVYGVAFDLSFDQNMLQTDSVKVIYTSSFLNAGNQNIDFDKAFFTNGKSYCATVRSNGNNASGFGKIGELWFKVKNNLPSGSSLNLAINNAQRVNKTGLITSLSNGTALMLNINNNPVGLAQLPSIANTVRFYPNPATNKLVLENDLGIKTRYTLLDITGRTICAGEFNRNAQLDISGYSGGSYFLQVESEQGKVTRKFIIER